MPGSWASQLREYSLSIIDKQKSLLSLAVPQDTFASGRILRPSFIQVPLFLNLVTGFTFSSQSALVDIPSLLCAIAGVLLMHKSLGCEAVDSLAAIAIVDPKLGAHLLLVILFFSNIFTRKDVISHTMLVCLPSVSWTQIS